MAGRPRRTTSDPMPDAPSPMLCTLVDAAFDSPDWTFEPKLDGLRVLARFDGSDVTLLSRNNKPQESRFPEIVEGLRLALQAPAIIDGEVVCLDETGKTSFRELQQRFHLDDAEEIRRRMERHPAYLYAFDILHADGSDVTRLPLAQRQDLLREAITPSDRIRITESVPGHGVEKLRLACEASEEGIVGKRLKGKFALIRMKPRGKGKPQWLLIKSKDEFAEAGSEQETPKPTAKRKTVAKSKAVSEESIPARATRPGKAPKSVELTHPDRVIYPEAGLTKADVFAYYDNIAERLLPFLKDRPITLERLPEGLAEKAPHFWQKDTPDHYPDWIPRIEQEIEQGKTVHSALVNDRATLLYLVNQGTLTFHVWASRTRDLDRPDFVLFDLDPGKASFEDVIAVAKSIKSTLDEAGVESFVKTSGKTGLHVLTPWTRDGGYDEARAWALELAERTTGAMPKVATTNIRKAKRGDRVYIDVLQNARGHHAVPPYVLRAVPGATVSTPLDWKEVKEGLDPKAFTLKKALARFTRRKTDPLEGLLKSFAARKKAAKG